MKLFILGAVLLLVSAASLADMPPGAAAPPATSGSSSANPPPAAGASQQRSGAKTSSNSCRKPAFGTCKGCEITCGAGEKPACGDALYSWNSNKCVRDAVCRCKARRS
jgi:hypothetical protein